MVVSNLKIGLFGFGCVGRGLYHVLNNNTGFKASIESIVVKDPSKSRNLAQELISYDRRNILDRDDITVVVELIDDADEAFEIVSEAMRKGKHVVTANKKMLAEHLSELIELQQSYNVSLLYEAAACGSIPIIRTLEEYFDNEDLKRVSGIFNGTTNYVLSRVNGNYSYSNALQQAQELGFAESDPTNDVEGFDPKFKAVILTLHAFGKIVRPEDILNLGITTLQEEDSRYAAEKGYKIKLMPVIERVGHNRFTVFIAPRFVDTGNQLYNVDHEYNGVIVEGLFSGEQFLQGRGAGSLPTGSAVLSDISALSCGYRYVFKKYLQCKDLEYTDDVLVEIYLRYNIDTDISHFQWNKVEEKYQSSRYGYTIGSINLSQLIHHRQYILEHKIFVCMISDNLSQNTNQINI
ncbi:MAG: homoserine dehydrogenase [Saprospiraceae bacterium]|nr:homoserine dehydrogenase [Saprospiraceae bacterium]